MNPLILKLHLTVILSSFTGIFGRLISSDAYVITTGRYLIALLAMILVACLHAAPVRMKPSGALRCAAAGAALFAHILTFYISIKLSNVSVCVVTISCAPFFTIILSRLTQGRPIVAADIIYALIAIAGVALIFGFDIKFRAGIAFGVLSALCSAVYADLNNLASRCGSAAQVMVREFAGGVLAALLCLPGYLCLGGAEGFVLSFTDLFYLLLAGLLCTALLYTLMAEVLSRLSAFRVMLTHNLVPLYSVILAMILFDEAEELNWSFAAGGALVVLSVVLKSRRPPAGI